MNIRRFLVIPSSQKEFFLCSDPERLPVPPDSASFLRNVIGAWVSGAEMEKYESEWAETPPRRDERVRQRGCGCWRDAGGREAGA